MDLGDGVADEDEAAGAHVLLHGATEAGLGLCRELIDLVQDHDCRKSIRNVYKGDLVVK